MLLPLRNGRVIANYGNRIYYLDRVEWKSSSWSSIHYGEGCVVYWENSQLNELNLTTSTFNFYGHVIVFTAKIKANSEFYGWNSWNWEGKTILIRIWARLVFKWNSCTWPQEFLPLGWFTAWKCWKAYWNGMRMNVHTIFITRIASGPGNHESRSRIVRRRNNLAFQSIKQFYSPSAPPRRINITFTSSVSHQSISAWPQISHGTSQQIK